MRRVVLSRTAEAELEAIADHIARDSPVRALSFVEELRAVCDLLAEHPERFPLTPRYAGLGVRRRAYRDYLVFYRVTAEAVEVLHVVHGARDVEALLHTSARPRD